jgi:hypothetical protein
MNNAVALFVTVYGWTLFISINHDLAVPYHSLYLIHVVSRTGLFTCAGNQRAKTLRERLKPSRCATNQVVVFQNRGHLLVDRNVSVRPKRARITGLVLIPG